VNKNCNLVGHATAVSLDKWSGVDKDDDSREVMEDKWNSALSLQFIHKSDNIPKTNGC
jgi:hypothetical protein